LRLSDDRLIDVRRTTSACVIEYLPHSARTLAATSSTKAAATFCFTMGTVGHIQTRPRNHLTDVPTGGTLCRMRESSLYIAVNQASGGTLRRDIAKARRARQTYDEIAAAITAATGIPVSREWVRKQERIHAGTAA
jgi:hypothetical protein